MIRVVRLNRLAEIELQEASDYYDQVAAGLRDAFLAEFERCCCLLTEHPEIGVQLRQSARRRFAQLLVLALALAAPPLLAASASRCAAAGSNNSSPSSPSIHTRP